MGNSKIVLGNETLIDLTQDTVNTKNLLAGVTAHAANGEQIVGELSMYNIVYATCTTAAATQQKVINISNNITLKNGDILCVAFSNTNSFNATASDPITFQIANTAYSVYPYDDTTQSTGTNTSLYGLANRSIYYRIDVTNHRLHYFSKQWDNNTTYSPASLGSGYGTCATAASTAAKVATLSGYNLISGGIVSIKFTYAVPANATLNINSKGAKNINYKGARITANTISAGDIATFIL